MKRLVAIGIALALTAGCGSSGLERGSVEGKVTLDGKEITIGAISFEPTGGTKGPAAGGRIEKGRYHVPADKGPVVGTNLIRLFAELRTGRMVLDSVFAGPESKMVPEVIEAFPPRYNMSSTLEREVKSGKNVFDFELTTK